MQDLLTAAIELTAACFIALPIIRFPRQWANAKKMASSTSLTTDTNDTSPTGTDNSHHPTVASAAAQGTAETTEEDQQPNNTDTEGLQARKNELSQLTLEGFEFKPDPSPFVVDIEDFYSRMSTEELLAEAKSLGIKANKRWKRETLIDRINAI